MNKEMFKGHWNEYKGKVKQTWAKLTDDDILKIEGKADELCGLIQKRYGVTKEQAETDIDKFVIKVSKEKH